MTEKKRAPTGRQLAEHPLLFKERVIFELVAMALVTGWKVGIVAIFATQLAADTALLPSLVKRSARLSQPDLRGGFSEHGAAHSLTIQVLDQPPGSAARGLSSVKRALRALELCCPGLMER